MSNTRTEIVTAIEGLLLGPMEENEVLESRPTETYLTGILWPQETGFTGDEDESLGDGDGESDSEVQDSVPLYRFFKPSSLGLTFTLEAPDSLCTIEILGARYEKLVPEPDSQQATDIPPIPPEDAESGSTPDVADSVETESWLWRRRPLNYRVEMRGIERDRIVQRAQLLDAAGEPVKDATIRVCIKHRSIDERGIVTVTLINQSPENDVERDEECLFQAGLKVTSCNADGSGRICVRDPEIRPTDPDSVQNALLYRDAREYAVGHGISAGWDVPDQQKSPAVYTTWMPQSFVPGVTPEGHRRLQSLQAEEPSVFAAAHLSDDHVRPEICKQLETFCETYAAWIETLDLGSTPPALCEQAVQNIQTCLAACGRMQEGVAMLSGDDDAWEAFRLANLTMEAQSIGLHRGDGARPLVWRPFQLAFLLMVIPSIVDPKREDRTRLDLLWFPTGGGKTEAYLGLTAFTIFHRRLTREDARRSPSVDVMMRYTLRLLTVQQFQRASAMICAADALRRSDEARLGTVPISIGLYVGQDSTPNYLAKYDRSARAMIEDEQSGKRPTSTPRQLLDCPYCGASLTPTCYDVPSAGDRMVIACENETCPSEGQPIPVHTVDEAIYSVRPSLIIGTVDKFAQLPRNARLSTLFGTPDGIPPELIIQDELHLISGPLGSMVGLYETVIDRLCYRDGVVPKVIGSTATIGQAVSQVRALFNRAVAQFPPPGLDARDSFFAVQDEDLPDRLYLGLSSSGRSPKFTLQAAIAASMSAAGDLLDDGVTSEEDLDPFWTTMIYFNSLRELGGAKVMLRDDVRRSIAFYSHRLDCEERQLDAEPLELTSRVSSNEIPNRLKEMGVTLYGDMNQGSPPDAVLASNMISVGMDIPRLGLMVVNGQPKSTSEYIQATSRIGRGIPGLVITCLNAGRPRDLSHFEHFPNYHQALYRSVEATSVTPWSPRARDRALRAVLVSLVRHLVDGMQSDKNAIAFKDLDDSEIQDLVVWILERAEASGRDIVMSEVADELNASIRSWKTRAQRAGKEGLDYWAKKRSFDGVTKNNPLQYAAEEACPKPDAWATPGSMREVEPTVYFGIWT